MLEPNGAAVAGHRSVALIVGVTGIAGSGLAETLSNPATSGGPWKVYGVARRPFPPWLATLNVDYVQCDITRADETLPKLSRLPDITHVFYVSWTGSEDCHLNTTMLKNVLDSVIPNAPNLRHVALQTGIKYYWGNMAEMDSTNQPHDCPFYEDLPRLNQDNFYYNLEDLVRESTAARRAAVNWSVHRPALIFGFSPCSMMNTVGTLCVYAAICKHEKKPLVYTGTETSWTCLWDAVDADLLAEHFVWAAEHPGARNQAFNVSNGDVFKWKHLWKVLANEFGLQAVGYEGKEPVLLEELMKGKEGVWDEIVKKNGLVATKLDEIAAFWLVDVVFRNKETLCSMNKNKEFGFLGFRDTTKSFVKTIDKMRAYRFIP
ncbi:(S)-8-oxocitronellyl enol synthase-like [Andrographis paniculata]|uniref:(S)-8-oxocitronellyl enol synthase-like n=1 Tax=Andrographis paniculata TaxID=175694 RepID=UPI0021E7B50D|nr:(S)-8-oxocitronellyl enol synthase-like [Andrographis paniculata]